MDARQELEELRRLEELETRYAAQVEREAVEQPRQTALNRLDKELGFSNLRRLGSGARSAFQGITFGAGDEIQGGIAALPVSALSQFTDNPMTIPEAYAASRDIARQELDTIRDEYPLTSFGSEIAGGLLTGSTAAKAGAKAAPNLAQKLAEYAARKPIASAGATAAATALPYTFLEADGDAVDRAGSALGASALAFPLGMAGGALARYFGRRVGEKAGEATQDAITNVQDVFDGEPTAVKSALAQLSPEQQQRAAVLKEAGIPLDQQTAAMVSRDPKTWQFEHNTKGIQGVGDDIRNRYIQANEFIRSKFEELGKSFGGKAATTYEAGRSVTDTLNKKNDEMLAEIGKLYHKVREEVGEDIGLQPRIMLEALDEAEDSAYADKLVDSMRRKMRRYGIIDKNNAPTGETLTVTQAEELRKFANKMYGDKQTDGVLRDVIGALDEDVVETVGVDNFRQARDAAKQRFEEFSARVLDKVARNKIEPDNLIQRTAFGGSVQDLVDLKTSLSQGTDEQIARGGQAWNDYKLQVLETVVDKAKSAGGKISGASFTKQLKKIGKERLDTIFDTEELLKIRTLEKALEYTTTEVPESVVNYSGTGAATANNVLSGMLSKSNTGEAMIKASGALSNVPIAGVPLSPVAAGLRLSGKALVDNAKSASVRSTTNPYKALRKLTNPAEVRAAGISAGVEQSRKER